MALRLLVVYDKGDGKVLAAVPNRRIVRRGDLREYCGSVPLPRVGCYYEEEGLRVDSGVDRVKILGRGTGPVLVDGAGNAKWFEQFIKNQGVYLDGFKGVKIDVEFGMGDQVIAWEAAKGLVSVRPGYEVVMGVHPVYERVVSFLKPEFEIEGWGPPGSGRGLAHVILNPRHKLWDPRGAAFGKASHYGAYLGMERVSEEVTFEMDPEVSVVWAIQAGLDVGALQWPTLGLHVKCVSRVASRWFPERAVELGERWRKKTKGSVVLIGDGWKGIRLKGTEFFLKEGCDWAATAAVISGLDLLVCVDSGPMHLGRVAGVPSLILWGGSGPRDILGRLPGEMDVRSDRSCIDDLCASCVFGEARCMADLMVDKVWGKVEGVLAGWVWG